MKAGWTVKKLGDVCKTGSGGTPLKARKEYYENGTIPWLLSGEVSQGEVHSATNFITQKGLENSSAKMFPENTVLVAMYGATAGQVGILRFAATTNQAVCGILPSKHFIPEFLFYLMVSRKDELVAQATGNAQPNISQIKINNICVPVPPLPEQHRLVALLDEAFAGIATAKAHAEKNLQNARALFDSHLEAVFSQRGEGWVEKKVSEIAAHSLGKMLDKAKNKGDAQPYLRNLNVRWFEFDLSDVSEMRFLPEEAKKYTAVRGDVLICEGGYPGRAAIWEGDDPIYFQKALHRVRFQEPGYNKWFVYFLYSQHKSGELRRHFTGTGIQHFTGAVLGRMRMPVPPVLETQRLVSEMEKLDEKSQRLEALYRQKLAALEELKKALLFQAFAGEL
jgi:type I restriction enzyme S subunit